MATLAAEKQEDPTRKKGILGRFRRGKKKKKGELSALSAKEDVSPSIEKPDDRENDDDTPVTIEEVDQMKQVRFPVNDAVKDKIDVCKDKQPVKPPPAQEAAYGGPPRYDWIDIETAAAVKVQSVYRRNKTMTALERDGITTAAIRNRMRRRQARMEDRDVSGSADMPNLLACCGVGLAFGDATEESYEASREHEREEYLERKREKEAKEEELRKNFKTLAAAKKASRKADVQEVYEVVE